jgi:cytoskeletal protein CcmA (bactofilin family)
MWSKQQTGGEPPAASPAQGSATPVSSLGASPISRTANPAARNSARIGAGLKIKGHITGTEDLQIDGKVEGPVTLRGHELIVGPTAQLDSEVHAGDVVAYGKIVGHVNAQGRVDIKKDGSITGDISCARISIEDGAHFKGRIEIDPAKSQAAAG